MNITNEHVEKARQIAVKAHEGQRDKGGKPYIHHLEFVASHVTTTKQKCVAYMHDLFEDTDYPRDEIREIFGDEIYDSIVAMTHLEGESYTDYISRLSKNPICRAVKIADLTNNMNLSRLSNITDKDRQRVAKYEAAKAFLETIEI